MLIPVCKEYYQFMLAQGILYGIGSALMFTPIMTVPSQWFARRRALATAVAVTGSGLGGTLWPIAIRRMIDQIGEYLGFRAARSVSRWSTGRAALRSTSSSIAQFAQRTCCSVNRAVSRSFSEQTAICTDCHLNRLSSEQPVIDKLVHHLALEHLAQHQRRAQPRSPPLTPGFPWTIRACGFIALFCFTCANLLIKTRLPRKKPTTLRTLHRPFKDKAYSLFLTGMALAAWGSVLPLSQLTLQVVHALLLPLD